MNRVARGPESVFELDQLGRYGGIGGAVDGFERGMRIGGGTVFHHILNEVMFELSAFLASLGRSGPEETCSSRESVAVCYGQKMMRFFWSLFSC